MLVYLRNRPDLVGSGISEAHVTLDGSCLTKIQVDAVLDKIDALASVPTVEILLIPGIARNAAPFTGSRIFDIPTVRGVAVT